MCLGAHYNIIQHGIIQINYIYYNKVIYIKYAYQHIMGGWEMKPKKAKETTNWVKKKLDSSDIFSESVLKNKIQTHQYKYNTIQ